MSQMIVVGAGVNGVTAAIELKKRGHDVLLLDPGPLPHPLAASTDISKVVRAAYGGDEEYTALAERSIKLWRQWNEEFGTELYHETGVMFVRRRQMEPGDFEYESLKLLERRGVNVARVDASELSRRFPAWNSELYRDGVREIGAGYAESGRAVAVLIERAKALGVELRTGSRFVCLDEDHGRVKGIMIEENKQVISRDRERNRQISGQDSEVARRDPSVSLGMTILSADRVVMAVGAWTPYLLPFTKKFFRATGQPVFHLRPSEPELFEPKRFPVFGADITSTGYYGFPINRDGLVKIANHGPGREMSPSSSERVVTAEDEKSLREFLGSTFPSLLDAPIVYTRVCMYCDTHDGHFWIAPDPDREGLIVAAGDSGHGFKFAPVLGDIIADSVEGKENPLLKKFRWRPEVHAGSGTDAARSKA
jgi:glycine/D-amino acid oxidase-like deaminating enzyme